MFTIASVKSDENKLTKDLEMQIKPLLLHPLYRKTVEQWVLRNVVKGWFYWGNVERFQKK